MKPPWWFCNGWWSPGCVIDTIAHDVFRVPLSTPDDSTTRDERWICRKHDAAIKG